jgi:hypothetical protein
MSGSQPTINQLIRMMEFCDEYSFIIPSYNLVIPEEAMGSKFRVETTFRLLRSGFMTYSGSSGKGKIADINVGGIRLPQPWIDRAYILLSRRVKDKVKEKAIGCKMEHIQELLLRFGKVEFLHQTSN